MESVQFIDLIVKPQCRGYCNNNCLFCWAGYARQETDYTKLTMDTERVKSELYQAKCENLEAILFSGSGTEPTMRTDIIELISYANKLGYKNILLHSNGRMFYYPEFTKKVVDSGCTSVYIALHAQNAELHDKITMTPGSFEQTVQGIKNLLVYRDKIKIEIWVVIHKINYKHLPAIARFISKEFKGIHNVFISSVDVLPAEAAYVPKLIVRLTDVKPYLEAGLAVLEKNGFEFSVNTIPFCLIDNKYWKNIPNKHKPINEGLKTFKPPSSVGVESACTIFKSCDKCVMKEKCPGTWESYASEVGASEFKPIKSR